MLTLMNQFSVERFAGEHDHSCVNGLAREFATVYRLATEHLFLPRIASFIRWQGRVSRGLTGAGMRRTSGTSGQSEPGLRRSELLFLERQPSLASNPL